MLFSLSTCSFLVGGRSCELTPGCFQPLFKRNRHSVWPHAEYAILRFNFLMKPNSIENSVRISEQNKWEDEDDLLVEVKNIDSALFISNFDVTEVLFELHVDHLLSDRPSELVSVDVDFDFSFLISPRELRNFLRGHSWYSHGCCSLHGRLLLRYCTNQNGISTVNLSITLEMLRAIRIKVFVGMCIIVLKKQTTRCKLEKILEKSMRCSCILLSFNRKIYLQSSVPCAWYFLWEHSLPLHPLQPTAMLS